MTYEHCDLTASLISAALKIYAVSSMAESFDKCQTLFHKRGNGGVCHKLLLDPGRDRRDVFSCKATHQNCS